MQDGGFQGFSMGGDPSGSTDAPSPGQQQFSQPVQPAQGQGQQGNSYADTFLASVPDNVRPIIEPYARQWDGGVTRQFQQLQGQLQEYQQFGDVEDLQAAAQLYDMLATSPLELLQLLHQGLDGRPEYQQWVQQTYGGAQAAPQPQWPGQQFQQQVPPGVPQGFTGQQPFSPQVPVQGPQGQFAPQQPALPPEFQQKFSMLENVVQQLAQHTLATHQAAQEAQEDEQLEDYLDELRQTHGDFDETYVLSLANIGMPFEQAIQQYQTLAAGRPLPPTPGSGPTLSGGGAPPQQAQTVKDLSNKDVQNLVSSVLAQVNQAGN